LGIHVDRGGQGRHRIWFLTMIGRLLNRLTQQLRSRIFQGAGAQQTLGDAFGQMGRFGYQHDRSVPLVAAPNGIGPSVPLAVAAAWMRMAWGTR
jgi:hypothetical protein